MHWRTRSTTTTDVRLRAGASETGLWHDRVFPPSSSLTIEFSALLQSPVHEEDLPSVA